jgi:hypothetical protein
VWVVRLIDAGHTPEHAEDCAGTFNRSTQQLRPAYQQG